MNCILSRLFRAVILTTPQDLDSIVYLAFNQVFPAYEGLELGIGDALLVKAVVEATGRTKQAVEAAYKSVGDLGIVALESRSKQATLGFSAKPKPLTARLVLEELRHITRTTGGKSMDRKVGIIKKMMISCQGMEAKYLVRALQGKLRIGLAAQTVLVSLAQAFVHCMNYLPFSAATSPAPAEEDDAPEEEATEQEAPSGGPPAKKRRVVMESDEEEATPATTTAEVSEGEAGAGASPTGLLENLFKNNEPPEAKAIRLAVQVMKNKKGASSQHHKSTDQLCELAVIAVKRAFSECPNSSSIVAALLAQPLHELHRVCRLQPGVPVAPMLAKPSKQVADVLKRLEGQLFTMEYKYDGERAQVHLLNDGKSSVKIFSRNSEDNSLKYPDLGDIVRYDALPPVYVSLSQLCVAQHGEAPRRPLVRRGRRGGGLRQGEEVSAALPDPQHAQAEGRGRRGGQPEGAPSGCLDIRDHLISRLNVTITLRLRLFFRCLTSYISTGKVCSPSPCKRGGTY